MPPYDEYGSGWDQTSSNAARSVAQYDTGDLGPQRGPAPWQNTHDDPDLMTRIWRSLFANGQKGITSQPLPPPAGSQAMNPQTPFGPSSQTPPEPKPASRLSSNRAIIERISKMLGAVNEPPPVSGAEWGMPDGSGAGNAPFDMSSGYSDPWSRLPPFNVMRSGMIPGQMPQRVDMRTAGLDRLYPGNAATQPGTIVNMAGSDPSPFGRANGGPIPHLMRGGYPNLYGVDESGVEPMRTFDSGGANYVDSTYSDGDGRADDVNAKLSAKEYVLTSEDMALLGNGNPDAGAKKMDQMRVQLRKHKGKAMADGKISPNAKNPMEYLIGNPMGDGLRRRGREKG